MNNLDRFKLLRQEESSVPVQIDSGVDQSIASLGSQREQALTNLAITKQSTEAAQEPMIPLVPEQVEQSPMYRPSGEQASMIPGGARVTQTFGQRSRYDVFSGGVNYGVDFAIKEGTPLALPPGEWVIQEAFSGATGRGRIGDSTNRGYGNSILAVNARTGESLRLSHLSGVNVRPGMKVPGGSIIGRSGATGNATGAHLDLEYRDSSGRLADPLKTRYAQHIMK